MGPVSSLVDTLTFLRPAVVAAPERSEKRDPQGRRADRDNQRVITNLPRDLPVDRILKGVYAAQS